LEIEIFSLALLMTLLGAAYVKGYDLVKKKSPEHLPHFYLIMATIRMLLVLTVVGIYALFSHSRADTIHFALIGIGMYVVMMVITLSLRH
jgi:cytochrome c biogenesis factor